MKFRLTARVNNTNYSRLILRRNGVRRYNSQITPSIRQLQFPCGKKRKPLANLWDPYNRPISYVRNVVYMFLVRCTVAPKSRRKIAIIPPGSVNKLVSLWVSRARASTVVFSQTNFICQSVPLVGVYRTFKRTNKTSVLHDCVTRPNYTRF